ncbi:MAG TPA: hypothetical protein VFS23_29265 [Vicinamibacterales bacterium]|nr:hypothetical protein [Vicinamibacterales bacterium]
MRLMRLLHKWLSLVVGLQLVLWTASGLVFAWLEHDAVTAHRELREPKIRVLEKTAIVIEPAAFLRNADTLPLDVRLLPLAGEWVYRLQFDARVELRRAADGTAYAMSEPAVSAIADARYAGTGSLRKVALRHPPVIEARDAGAVWEASYDDSARTALYFSDEDGRFIAARNDTWRLFDFFWMLHTMDFRGRDDFNNPLVILFTTGALWVGFTGTLLLLQVFGVTARLESGLRSRARTKRK